MFLNNIEKGNNRVLSMFLMVLVVVLALLISQGAAGLILVFLSGSDILSNQADIEAMNFAKYGLSNNLVFFILMASFLLPFLALLMVKPFHQRPFKSIITSSKKIRWKRIIIGVGIWFAILFLSTLVDYFLDPDNYELSFDMPAFLIMLAISLVLFPFQVGFEEIFFRGYLYQVFAFASKRPWLAWLVTSLAFAMMHSANPEIQEYGFWTMFPQYVLLGMFLGLITILDGGLELALGVHFINNLFLAVGVNYKGAVLKTDAIYSLKTMDPTGGWIGILLSSVVFMAILWKSSNWGAQLPLVFKKYSFQTKA